MTKVLRILNRFNLGGPTYNVAYLTKYMSPEFETLLIGGKNEKSEKNSEYIVENLDIHPTIIPEMQREISLINDYKAYLKIKKIIKEYKPDIVHTHASKAGMLGRYAAYRCKVPIIIHTFHGHVFYQYFNKYQTLFFKKTERFLAKKTDAIIAISEIQKYELTKIHKIAPEEKFRVIPLGFDLDRFQENYEEKRKNFRNLYNISNETIVITTIGRLVPIKNHKLFIGAIAKIKQQTDKKIIALIVGDGELKETLITFAKNQNLNCQIQKEKIESPDIIFTSWIKEADIVLAASDIAVLTSFNEGTPVSLIEAQAANTPVVSTNTGGIEDIILKNKTGLLSENNNIENFSEKLLQLIENDELRNTMSDFGWDFVKNKFHYTRLVNDMKNLYNDLLNEKNI
ncbi:MAG: glycosyltransferase [Bacteroidales bacterium]|jgi:glycosyltransferase involved in cell wall biosynthesis|nr:glycosyltransferase [Bacteroidales bacterium]